MAYVTIGGARLKIGDAFLSIGPNLIDYGNHFFSFAITNDTPAGTEYSFIFGEPSGTLQPKRWWAFMGKDIVSVEIDGRGGPWTEFATFGDVSVWVFVEEETTYTESEVRFTLSGEPPGPFSHWFARGDINWSVYEHTQNVHLYIASLGDTVDDWTFGVEKADAMISYGTPEELHNAGDGDLYELEVV